MNIPLKSEYLPALFNFLAAGIVFIICFFIDLKFPDYFGLMKELGIVVVYAGFSISLWAAFYLKSAINGMVLPKLNQLVKDGPYRYCRHPVYLGMTIAFIGMAIALRSWLGIISVLLLFLPSEIFRAKLEDAALSEKFGNEWDEYADNTNFFIPKIRIIK